MPFYLYVTNSSAYTNIESGIYFIRAFRHSKLQLMDACDLNRVNHKTNNEVYIKKSIASRCVEHFNLFK